MSNEQDKNAVAEAIRYLADEQTKLYERILALDERIVAEMEARTLVERDRMALELARDETSRRNRIEDNDRWVAARAEDIGRQERYRREDETRADAIWKR